jgi:tRNA G10  N-methylase Trm11
MNEERMKLIPATGSTPVLTATVGTNADLFPKILEMYVPDGSTVADVTYGKGVFWRNVEDGKYDLKATDLQMGVDFKSLPYLDKSMDALVLDPPYMHGGATVKDSINKCYRNQNTSHESVIRLYTGGILEAARVLKKGGRIIVKTQDEIESGRQRHSHVEILQILEMLGFRILDTFVLVQSATPAMREKYQKTARKNHSFALVGEFRR